MPEPITLRDYQQAAVEGLREGYRNGHRAQVLGIPTGAGKTIIAAYLLGQTQQKGRRAAFVVDRVSLVDQTSAVLDRYGIDHGVVQANHWRRRGHELIQVCSAQTIEKRGFFPELDLLVVDECHEVRTQTKELIQARQDIRVLGLSATPFSKGLGELYSNLVNVCSTNELIAAGFLVPVRMYAAVSPDMNGAKVVAGEWSDKEIEKRGTKIVGDIVSEWVDKTMQHFGGPVKTVVFSATVAHGDELCRQFNAAGYEFHQISYKDGDDDHRRELIEEFRKPDSSIHGLISCEVFTKGFDVPDVLCGISARPYRKSLSSHIQQLGRVMRPSPGKDYALWLCIARGSRVLTDQGLVPIEEISLSHKIWDGTNFVEHKGAVCNGIQKVISYRGLTATPGHLVHTAQGWRTFGDCANEQIAITQTGFGGNAIRLREDHQPGCALAGREETTLHTCGLRMREVWLSLSDFAIQLGKWAHEGLQAMQSASAGISNVVVCAGAGNESPLPQYSKRSIFTLRRLRCGVSIRGSEGRCAVDHAEPWNPAEPRESTIGSNQPVWALRAGQYQVANSSAQSVEQARKSGNGESAQVQTGTSGDKIRGQHAQASVLERNDGYSGDREIPSAIMEAEREVWDILDAGPHNRFTCEGLLVHNCHSGNVIRFGQETAEIFADGLHSLDDGKLLDKAPRPEPTQDEIDAIKCGGCGYILPHGADMCPMCGRAVPKRRNLIEAVHGDMVEVGGKNVAKKHPFLADREHVWRQICGLALYRKKGDAEAAERFAKAQYRNIYGAWPRHAMRNIIPCDWTPDIERLVHANLIRWAKSHKAA